jgi:acetyltransferase-like isoleucine patch superfamily enzyme
MNKTFRERLDGRGRAEMHRVRSWTLRRRFGSSGSYLFAGRRITVINPGRMSIGNSVVIGDDTTLASHPGGRLVIGDRVHIGRGCIIACGDDELVIEDGVGIGAYCSIRNADHGTAAGERFSETEWVHAPVRVGRDSFIGDRCGIVRGVSIGEGAVIAANSLVTSDIPAGAFAIGVPARIMGARQ